MLSIEYLTRLLNEYCKYTGNDAYIVHYRDGDFGIVLCDVKDGRKKQLFFANQEQLINYLHKHISAR